jgi:hypothetical protein
METTAQTGSSSRQNPAVMNREDGEIRPVDDLLEYLQTYAKQKPEMAALWCFGIGFVLGWRLKPW